MVRSLADRTFQLRRGAVHGPAGDASVPPGRERQAASFPAGNGAQPLPGRLCFSKLTFLIVFATFG